MSRSWTVTRVPVTTIGASAGVGGRAIEREGQLRRALQRGGDVLDGLALEAVGAAGHRVGTADGQAAGREAAVSAGRNRPDRAGAGVGHLDTVALASGVPVGVGDDDPRCSK